MGFPRITLSLPYCIASGPGSPSSEVWDFPGLTGLLRRFLNITEEEGFEYKKANESRHLMCSVAWNNLAELRAEI